MDAKGARILRFRLEQQRQWELADAVQEGRQPRHDPDATELTELRDGLRIYGEGGRPTIAKRLVDGWWRAEVYEDRDEAA
jgi:hypothetical protein